MKAFLQQSRDESLLHEAYFRLVLVDAEGNKAVTRGYFVDEIPTQAQGLTDE